MYVYHDNEILNLDRITTRKIMRLYENLCNFIILVLFYVGMGGLRTALSAFPCNRKYLAVEITLALMDHRHLRIKPRQRTPGVIRCNGLASSQ